MSNFYTSFGLSHSNSYPQDLKKLETIVDNPGDCNMFHKSQQSSAILGEYRRRNLLCYEQMRLSQLNRHELQSLPTSLPRPNLPGTVTLLMEVQCTDFASLVGQREAWSNNDSISAIISDTDCMIQFADQLPLDENNHFNPGDKRYYFNQVVVSGKFPNVAQAHNRIRALSPITVSVSLKNIKPDLLHHGKSVNDLLSEWSLIGGRLAKFNKIQFYVTKAALYSQYCEKDMFLVIRGSYRDSERLSEACKECCSLLFNSANEEEFCSRMEIPVSHRRWIVGSPDGILMRTISTLSGTTIHFPLSGKGQTPTSFFVSGNSSACISAVKMFCAVGPVRLEFDVENTQLVHPLKHKGSGRNVDQFNEEHNVIITVRKSQYEVGLRLCNEKMRHSISLMTSEENVNNLFLVRRQMLKEKFCALENVQPDRCSKRPRFVHYLRQSISVACTENMRKEGHAAVQLATEKSTQAKKKVFYEDNNKMFYKSLGSFGDHKNIKAV